MHKYGQSKKITYTFVRKIIFLPISFKGTVSPDYICLKVVRFIRPR